MPLHMGTVCGEHVRCAYHGWTYDGAGTVTSIPYAASSVAAVSGVRGYPCREAYGFVFVFPGNPALAATVPLPAVPVWESGGFAPMYFSRRVHCHYTFMHENLMDMNHQALHGGLMGRLLPTSLRSRQGERWIDAEYQFSASRACPGCSC